MQSLCRCFLHGFIGAYNDGIDKILLCHSFIKGQILSRIRTSKYNIVNIREHLLGRVTLGATQRGLSIKHTHQTFIFQQIIKRSVLHFPGYRVRRILYPHLYRVTLLPYICPEQPIRHDKDFINQVFHALLLSFPRNGDITILGTSHHRIVYIYSSHVCRHVSGIHLPLINHRHQQPAGLCKAFTFLFRPCHDIRHDTFQVHNPVTIRFHDIIPKVFIL